MNAYELADWLDRRRDAYEPNGWSADMLRQQAERIAELEKCLFQMQNACIDLTKQQSAEPVAWMSPDVLPLTHIIKAIVRREQDEQHSIPLYTTPQIKELSDEEISLVISESYQSIGNATLTDLCKAILKKATQ